MMIINITEDDFQSCDLVEIVRCRDCIYWDEFTCNNCDILDNISDCGCMPDFYTHRNFYCAFGERGQKYDEEGE